MLMKKVCTKHKDKTVKLFDTTIYLKFVDQDKNDNGSWIFGHTKFEAATCTIIISLKDNNGNPLTEKTINCTIRHEFFHAIFSLLYFGQERDNETLVEWLAQATNSLNEQGINI